MSGGRCRLWVLCLSIVVLVARGRYCQSISRDQGPACFRMVLFARKTRRQSRRLFDVSFFFLSVNVDQRTLFFSRSAFCVTVSRSVLARVTRDSAGSVENRGQVLGCRTGQRHRLPSKHNVRGDESSSDFLGNNAVGEDASTE